MSTEALSVGAVPAQDPAGTVVAAAQEPSSDHHNQTKPSDDASPAFLHSPPDSNNAVKSDASDSELSDLDEEPPLPDAPTLSKDEEPKKTDAPPESNPQPEADAEPEEDIGEVLPDHWSGAVPIFKPTMHQFKDFTRFVRCSLSVSNGKALSRLTLHTDEQGQQLRHEVWYYQDYPTSRMEGQATTSR